MKRILHLVTVKNIPFKSSYNWFKIVICQSGSDSSWLFNNKKIEEKNVNGTQDPLPLWQMPLKISILFFEPFPYVPIALTDKIAVYFRWPFRPLCSWGDN